MAGLRPFQFEPEAATSIPRTRIFPKSFTLLHLHGTAFHGVYGGMETQGYHFCTSVRAFADDQVFFFYRLYYTGIYRAFGGEQGCRFLFDDLSDLGDEYGLAALCWHFAFASLGARQGVLGILQGLMGTHLAMGVDDHECTLAPKIPSRIIHLTMISVRLWDTGIPGCFWRVDFPIAYPTPAS